MEKSEQNRAEGLAPDTRSPFPFLSFFLLLFLWLCFRNSSPFLGFASLSTEAEAAEADFSKVSSS
jgi:hypothetical protein